MEKFLTNKYLEILSSPSSRNLAVGLGLFGSSDKFLIYSLIVLHSVQQLFFFVFCLFLIAAS